VTKLYSTIYIKTNYFVKEFYKSTSIFNGLAPNILFVLIPEKFDLIDDGAIILLDKRINWFIISLLKIIFI